MSLSSYKISKDNLLGTILVSFGAGKFTSILSSSFTFLELLLIITLFIFTWQSRINT